jgi:hypothetical protein
MKTLRPNDLGKKFLVEECQKIPVSRFIKITKNKLRETLLNSELEYGKFSIKISTSYTHKMGIRYWFKCPLCHRRTGVIYLHPINNNLGCRICLNLRYKKSRFKGMVENN